MDVPVKQRSRRVSLEGDTCVIDGKSFFVRGCLEIPVVKSRHPFVWGVWVNVSRTSFLKFQRLLGVADRSHHGPLAGKLCSPPRPYPDSMNLRAKVHFRDDGLRALVELEASEHPLAIEQRNGITRKRLSDICSLMIHNSPRLMTADQILAALQRIEPWKARAMCASAAERAAPIFRKLCRHTSRPTFDAALDTAWSAIRSGGGGKVKRLVRRLPEASQDDSHNREYYAGRMLAILFYALDYASTDDAEKASQCLEHTHSICDAFDTLLTAAPGQTFRYDPKNPPPPGAIEKQELEAQAEVLELLRDATPDKAFTGSLRRRSRKRASTFGSTVARLFSSRRSRR
jgi:hypothetical protein